MADQLYLSYWISAFNDSNMLRHYEKMLKLFPFSRLTKSDATFRVIPVSYAEPPVVELPVKSPVEPAPVLEAAKEFQNRDCCYRLESAWDLWQYPSEWKLEPARVALCCFGPDFEKDMGENLRIEFGIDTYFLPQPEVPESQPLIQSNVKSLLKLVHDLDDNLRVQKRSLWTESGENFADKLKDALSA